MKSSIKIWVVFIFALFVLLQSQVSNAQTTNNIKIPKITKNLSYGLRNNLEVKTYQQFLKDTGYFTGPVTGNFLSLTLAASKNFQQAHAEQILKPAGLSQATGYVGTFTRKFFDNAIFLDAKGENPIIRFHTESGFSATPGEADLIIEKAIQIGPPQFVAPQIDPNLKAYNFELTFKNIGSDTVKANAFYLSKTRSTQEFYGNFYTSTQLVNIPGGLLKQNQSFVEKNVSVGISDNSKQIRFYINTQEIKSSHKGSRFPGIPELNYNNNTLETTVQD